MIESTRWLEQNRDADKFFLTVECFDPHEPWFVPEHYRKMYDPADGPEQVISRYAAADSCRRSRSAARRRTIAGSSTMCDRWFGHLIRDPQVAGHARQHAAHGHHRPRSLYRSGATTSARGAIRPAGEFSMCRCSSATRRASGRASACDVFIQHHDLAADTRCGRCRPARADRRPDVLGPRPRRWPADPRSRDGRLGQLDHGDRRPLVVQLQDQRPRAVPVRFRGPIPTRRTWPTGIPTS